MIIRLLFSFILQSWNWDYSFAHYLIFCLLVRLGCILSSQCTHFYFSHPSLPLTSSAIPKDSTECIFFTNWGSSNDILFFPGAYLPSYFSLFLPLFREFTTLHHVWFPRRHTHKPGNPNYTFSFPSHLLSQLALTGDTVENTSALLKITLQITPPISYLFMGRQSNCRRWAFSGEISV